MPSDRKSQPTLDAVVNKCGFAVGEATLGSVPHFDEAAMSQMSILKS